MHHSRDAIGRRLQEERQRLGFVQAEFAEKVGLAKRTLAGYEGGQGDIGATALAAASDIGVDILYVVTGRRTPADAAAVTGDRLKMLETYDKISPPDKASVLRLAEALAVYEVKE